MISEKQKQVVAQCRVVAYLAKALAEIAEGQARMMEGEQFANLTDQIGERSAEWMETVGEMLNSVDAVTEDDEWTHPVFKEAQRLWP